MKRRHSGAIGGGFDKWIHWDSTEQGQDQLVGSRHNCLLESVLEKILMNVGGAVAARLVSRVGARPGQKRPAKDRLGLIR